VAIRKYKNIIARETIAENAQLHTQHTNAQRNKPHGDNANQSSSNVPNGTLQKGKIHTGYRTYKEWIKLTPEQHS
jgi:hypothetical protein